MASSHSMHAVQVHTPCTGQQALLRIPKAIFSTRAVNKVYFYNLVFLRKNFVLLLVLKTASTAHAPCTLDIIPWKYGGGIPDFHSLHFMVQFPLKSGIPMKSGIPNQGFFT